MNDDDSGVHKPLVDNFEKFQELTDQISENIPIVANYVEALKEYKGKMGTEQDTKSMRTRMNHEMVEANELIKQTLDLIQDLEDLKFKNKKDTDNKKKMLRRLNNSFEEYYEEFTKLIKEIHSNEKRFIDLQQSVFNASTLSEQDHKGSVYDSLVQKSSLIGENNEGNNHAVEHNHAIIGSIHENDDENEEVHIDDIVVESGVQEAVVENNEEVVVNGGSIVRNQEEEKENAAVVEEKLQDKAIVENKEIEEEIEKEKKKNESIVGEQQEIVQLDENTKGEEEEKEEEVVKENIQGGEEPVHRQEEEEEAVIEEDNAKENITQEAQAQEEEVKENIEEPTPLQEEAGENEEENQEVVTDQEEVKENIEEPAQEIETPVQEEIKENEEIIQEATIQRGAEEVKEEIVYETPAQAKVQEEIIEGTVQEPVIFETQQNHKESIRKEEVLNLDAVPEKNPSIIVQEIAAVMSKESIHEKKNGESVILKKSIREEVPRASIKMQSSIVREDVQTLKQSIMDARNNLELYASIIQERERQMATVKRISSETNLLEGHRERHEEGNVGIVINDVSHSHTMDRVIEGGVEKKEKKSNTGRNVLIVLAIILILGGVGAAVAFGKK